MRKIGALDFRIRELRDFILERYYARDFFKMRRSYIAPTATVFDFWHLAKVFSNIKEFAPLVEGMQAKLREASPEHTHLREATYSLVMKGQSHLPFITDNYLDGVSVRVHLAITGPGTYYLADQPERTLSYKVGDLIMFDQESFGQVMVHKYIETSEQLVICVGKEADRHLTNWRLFAEGGQNAPRCVTSPLYLKMRGK